MGKSKIDRELEQLEKDIVFGQIHNEHLKNKFINEIKSDLGVQIKTNPNKIKPIKSGFIYWLKVKVKFIFKRFGL